MGFQPFRCKNIIAQGILGNGTTTRTTSAVYMFKSEKEGMDQFTSNVKIRRPRVTRELQSIFAKQIILCRSFFFWFNSIKRGFKILTPGLNHSILIKKQHLKTIFARYKRKNYGWLKNRVNFQIPPTEEPWQPWTDT